MNHVCTDLLLNDIFRFLSLYCLVLVFIPVKSNWLYWPVVPCPNILNSSKPLMGVGLFLVPWTPKAWIRSNSNDLTGIKVLAVVDFGLSSRVEASSSLGQAGLLFWFAALNQTSYTHLSRLGNPTLSVNLLWPRKIVTALSLQSSLVSYLYPAILNFDIANKSFVPVLFSNVGESMRRISWTELWNYELTLA